MRSVDVEPMTDIADTLTGGFARIRNNAERDLEKIRRSIVGGIPCEILRIFNATDGGRCVSSYRTLDDAQQAAADFYENLDANPNTRIEFPTPGPNGTIVRRGTSIGQLMLLGAGWQNSTLELQRCVDLAKEMGAVTEDIPSDAGRHVLATGFWPGRAAIQHRAETFYRPEDILKFPASQGIDTVPNIAYTTNPLSLPAWFPTVESKPVLYPTPRMIDRNALSDERLRGLYERTWVAIFEYLRDRNAPLQFHPLVLTARQPIQLMNAPAGTDGLARVALDQFRAQTGGAPSPWLFSNSALGFRVNEGDPNLGISFGGPQSFWWNNSLTHRIPWSTTPTPNDLSSAVTRSNGVLHDRDENRTWNLWTADACLELLRVLNIAWYLLRSGDANGTGRAALVDVFAVNTVYKGLQVEAYRQIRRDYGANVNGYRRAIADEANARANSARTDRIGMPGYHSSGDEAADITAEVMQTVQLAVTAAIAAGPLGIIAAVGFKGIQLLMDLILSPDRPVSPYDLPLHVNGPNSPQAFGISVNSALTDRPCYRYPR